MITATTLPLAQTLLQQQLWDKLSPVNIPSASDTYKRTMSDSGEVFADRFACYSAAARKPLKEEGVSGRHIMAGLEGFLYPWFSKPVTRESVEIAREHFTTRGRVQAFPHKAWDAVLANGGYFPLDIWALRGGQTFLSRNGKYVPFMSVEGMGALATHLEPHVENMYAPIIQATKARLFRQEVGPKSFAEFGLRSDRTINTHTELMIAVMIGGGYTLTSDDQAVLMFPEYFSDIGTMGHEFVMAYQRNGISLAQAQEMAYRDFINANQRSALLPDVIETVSVGLPMILKFILEYQGSGKVIMPRFDSGDVVQQCIIWKKMTLAAGIQKIQMVVEDGYTPGKAKKTKEAYAAAGFDPDDIIVGAGGYFQEGCTRDAISLVFKRSATMWDVLEVSMKFSDSPGKESIPGQLRIYARGRTMIVAQAGEEIDGELLSVKVLDQGRIVNVENLFTQSERAANTWDAYDDIEYSPLTQQMIDERQREKAAA